MNEPDAARVLADELADKGRMREAIVVLTEANRLRPNAEIERRLVELRRDAPFPTPSRRVRSWPPRVRDRFRGASGIPEVRPHQLNVKTLRSGILRHGCLLVRGLLDNDRVHTLVDDIDQAFAAFDAYAAGAAVDETAPWFVPFDPGPSYFIPREWGRAGGGVLAVDSPRSLFDLNETFEEIGMGELVAGFLGEPPVMLANKWTLRRAREEEAYTIWHQDGAFMGRDIRSLNVWIALSDCGIDAPSLDVVARRLDEIVETGTDGARFDWCVGDKVAERVAGADASSPVFAAGDALLFDHMLLHRTAIRAGMTHERHAIEAWFAAPAFYPKDQIAIAY